MKLFTTGNPKTEKGAALGYFTAVLHLAPYKLSGLNVCPMAELAGCIHACLNTAGRGGIAAGGAVTFDSIISGTKLNAIQHCRIARTRLFHSDQAAFMAQIAREIVLLQRKAARYSLQLVVRMNGTSDIRWENVPANGFPNIMAQFPHIRFYDYTKIANRKHLPENYSVTFSYSGRAEFAPFAAKAMASGLNVAVVFDRHMPVPETFMGRRVVNGDETDLRFLDPVGVVVALKAKGKAQKDQSGFVVRAASINLPVSA